MEIQSVRRLTELSTIYQRLSTGQRINSAADDAAGMAVSNKIGALARGIDKGTDNARDMQNLLRTAEGGLNSINDSLQRLREIGVQALNGIYTDSDQANMQQEVGQILDHVKTAAQNTEFNTMKLLDGSFADKQTASSPNGNGMTINIANTTLESLGIKNFDVTRLITITDTVIGSDGNPQTIVKQDFETSLSAIDKALEAVNDARSKIGAQTNALEYTVNANETAYINQMQALSKIADADVAKESTRLSAANVLRDAQVYMQKNQMARAGGILNLLG